MRTLFTKSTVSTFAIALALLSAAPSEAGVRARVDVTKDLGPATLRVRLQTPDHVQWHRKPAVRVRHVAPALHVTPYDRDVAFRLSVMTGLPERPLLQKRARGVSWIRIANVHGIAQRDLKIAKSPHRYRKWVERQNAYLAGPCGIDDHRHDHWKGHGKDHGKGRGHDGQRGKGGRHGR